MGPLIFNVQPHFYPRSPYGERQLTAYLNGQPHDFYPRSPYGERQGAHRLAHAPPQISIHALLTESDRAASITPAPSRNFYPRSPYGERPMQIVVIIVHALFLSTLSLRRATYGP